MEIYKRAWETHDSSLLEKIFTTDATYQEKPENILNGLEEIQSYWSEISQTQHNVKFTVKEITECGTVIVVEWSSKFERTDLDETWQLDGVMLLHMEKYKISRLKEYFFINKSKSRAFNPA